MCVAHLSAERVAFLCRLKAGQSPATIIMNVLPSQCRLFALAAIVLFGSIGPVLADGFVLKPNTARPAPCPDAPKHRALVATGSQTLTGTVHLLWVNREASGGTCAPLILLSDANGKTSEIIPGNSPNVSNAALQRLQGKSVTLAGKFLNVSDRQFTPNSIIVSDASDNSFMVPSLKLWDAGDGSGGNPAYRLGPKPYVTLCVRFSDATGVTPQPLSYYQGLMGSVYPGTDDFWSQQSFGLTDFTGSSVMGWYNLPNPKSYYVNNSDPLGINWDNLRNDAITVAAPFVNFSNYYGINLMLNEDIGNGWGGLGTSDYPVNVAGVVGTFAIDDPTRHRAEPIDFCS